MNRAYYSDPIDVFLQKSDEQILGTLVQNATFAVELPQRDAWLEQIRILQHALAPYAANGKIYFEYSVPRLGKRIDAIVLVDRVLFVLEFKVGERQFLSSARDQVWDYALDLKNFHETSHHVPLAPVLIATNTVGVMTLIDAPAGADGLFPPMDASPDQLTSLIDLTLRRMDGPPICAKEWERGRYCPTPTIIEAATALYGGHSVDEISRNDAEAINLSQTSKAISEVIRSSRDQHRKSICFVTGVPGAGKTLVGLDIATRHFDKKSELYSVFLSGNGPLVKILTEALTRDRLRQERERGKKLKKGEVMNEVEAFIQNVHHFRDDSVADVDRPPIEHVALFDEAQRAWDLEHTADFMLRKKKRPDFDQSEPQFLISCLDRHPDWAVIVCLVGGGQEINTGEAGISEWIRCIVQAFPSWQIYISSRLHDSEYTAGNVLEQIAGRDNVNVRDEFHSAVSMRSFRAEHVSTFVKQLLDLDEAAAHATLAQISSRYPIVLTRDLPHAKAWLKARARGSERFGITVSSKALRLKPLAIDVRAPIDPVHWFLDGKDDVRSSYQLEDVATEFDVQGLELDWSCVVWDADFRLSPSGWEHWSFRGSRWERIGTDTGRNYLKNAYRVLLTRARQGLVIVVPHGDDEDFTRRPEFYDGTFEYLARLGLTAI